MDFIAVVSRISSAFPIFNLAAKKSFVTRQVETLSKPFWSATENDTPDRVCRCLVKEGEWHDSSRIPYPYRALGAKEKQLCTPVNSEAACMNCYWDTKERYNVHHLGEVALRPDSRKGVWCLESSSLKLHSIVQMHPCIEKKKKNLAFFPRAFMHIHM